MMSVMGVCVQTLGAPVTPMIPAKIVKSPMVNVFNLSLHFKKVFNL
jgi:hypothetical protein